MNKKILSILVIFLLMASFAAGCGQKKNTEGEKKELPEQGGKSEAEVRLTDISGIYTGQIDNNSIEIKTDNKVISGNEGFAAFRLPEGLQDEISKLDTNDKVRFSCLKNGQGQWELTAITKE